MILAYSVLLSHIHVRICGINPGVFAVITFYILSGYVVTRLWDDILPGGDGRLWRFYRDRFLRIAPLYVYVYSLTIIFLLSTDYGRPVYSGVKLLGNLFIIPLNYYMWLDTTILSQPAWCLMPPAWSLGAEEQAYLLLSLLLIMPRMKQIIAPLSFVVFMLASFNVINSDYFGYRLLPGVFFIFIIGHCLYRVHSRRENRFDKLFPTATWVTVAAVGLWLFSHGTHTIPYVRETFLGLLFGIPVANYLNNSKIKMPGNTLCGSLSYGVFLSHFLVIWYLDLCGYPADKGMDNGPLYLVLLSCLTLLISWLGIRWVERPVDNYRKR